MLYDVLDGYKQYLELSYRPQTVQTYCNRLEWLLQGQSILKTVEKLEIQKILDNLSLIKHKNKFSQSKNAFLQFLKYENILLSDEQLKQLKTLENQTHKKYKKKKVINYKKIDQTIKHLKNKKLKLCYQVLLSTGLRVSELSQIIKNDCTVSGDSIIFSFVAKGGTQEKVIISKEDNSKLFDELKEHISTVQTSEKVFYSCNYLQAQAKKLNFQCHDLRRICAKLEYKKTRSKKEVQKKLRHDSVKNTNIYLKSKIEYKE